MFLLIEAVAVLEKGSWSG